MINKKILRILEKNNIILCGEPTYSPHHKEYYVEIEFYSVLREDVIETVFYNGKSKGFIEGFKALAEEFDEDEHAELWIEFRGRNGVPSSIRQLIKDAENIKATLENVSEQLLKVA